MYFFRIEISSFEDEAKTIFVIPEQIADEKGVPFEEKMLTQTVEYKAFIKETKTNLIDGKYTQYMTDAPLSDTITSDQFEQLYSEGKI